MSSPATQYRTAETPFEDRVLDGPASEERGSKGRHWLDRPGPGPHSSHMVEFAGFFVFFFERNVANFASRKDIKVNCARQVDC